MNITYCDIFARIMSEMLSRLSLKKIKSFGKSMITFLYSKVYTCENNLVAYNTNASPQICIQYRFHIVIIGRFPSLIRDRRLTNPWKKCENASKSKKKPFQFLVKLKALLKCKQHFTNFLFTWCWHLIPGFRNNSLTPSGPPRSMEAFFDDK